MFLEFSKLVAIIALFAVCSADDTYNEQADKELEEEDNVSDALSEAKKDLERGVESVKEHAIKVKEVIEEGIEEVKDHSEDVHDEMDEQMDETFLETLERQAKNAGQSIKDAAHHVGESFKDAGEYIGEKIGVVKPKSKTEEVFISVGDAVKENFGRFDSEMSSMYNSKFMKRSV